ncbi:MAG: hypothetical protein PVJ05_10150 [Candidatus Thorarchaeota archaeon]|jgi:protocatechuate 3,4-dioxygenase beta subunit
MSPSRERRISPYRPIAKRMDTNLISLAKSLIVVCLLIMFVLPISMNYEPTQIMTHNESPTTIAQEESLYHYSLPDTNIRIAVGEISGVRGIAYVIEEESRLYFVDILTGVSMDIALPLGVKANGAYLTGFDVDLDGDTEFFLRNFVDSTYYILMVDIDNATVSEYPMPINMASPMGFGKFNGDAYPDLLVLDVSTRDDLLTLDLIANTTIGTIAVDYAAYITPVIGDFTGGTTESIAIVNRAGTTSARNLTVVEADGTQVDNIILSSSIQDYVKFDYPGAYDEIATIQSDGNIVVYTGDTLSLVYSQLVDVLPTNYRWIETGDFNADPQDDLVVISRDQEMAFFRDGNAGAPIREVNDIYTFSTRHLGVGRMDHDALDDLAIGTTLGGLGVIRGVDGEFANLEYLVDVRQTAYQIISYDYFDNGRDDVLVRVMDGVYIITSDATEPIITPQPIDPLHPTVLDDYLTVKVYVDETSSLEHVDIWMRMPGSVLWSQPQEEMYESHTEGFYYAFIGDLQPGEYEYYIIAQDTYLNTGELGNATHPLVFTVAGDFVWQIDKSNTDFVHRKFHQSDVGNLSDGRATIYTIERASGSLDLTLTKYSRGGGVYDSLTIINPAAIPFDNFALFTAMLDGDNIQDIIVLDLYYDKDYIFRYHSYHGSNFSLMGSGTIPYAYKSFEFMGVFDDDGDGNEELFIVSDTEPHNVIKMDSDLSWTAVNLPLFDNNWYSPRGFALSSGFPNGFIAVVRGDIRIDILTTNLVYSHSLNFELSAYTNMDVIGIQTLHNATTGEDQFVAGFNYWNASDPTSRFYIFESTTTNLNNTPVYELLHQDMAFLYPADVVGDSSDELFITLPAGELLLTDPGATLSVIWTTPITGATPISATITDFDGDLEDELILFTDQDELLTQVSFTGEVEWTVEVGEVYNPLILGNIDLTPGVEIAAYPFATVTSYTIGAIRNLDSQYNLDVFVEWGSSDITQGEGFWANVTVANIYGEIVNDASVYMSAHFMTREGPGVNTFGFYFDWPSMKYQGSTDATWPIGIANLSVIIDNGFYHPFERTYVDAITIQSALDVTVDVDDLVTQGESMNVTIWVLDNQAHPVDDAAVSITLGGVGFVATQAVSNYIVTIPEIQLDAGIHIVTATADHTHAIDTGVGEAAITVQILTTSLTLVSDFPATVQQDELITAWFNVTDGLGQPVQGAIVSLRSGPRAFELVESSVLGSYVFSNNMTLGIGSQVFDVIVEKPGIIGPPVAQVSFDVFGNLTPNVFYTPRVEGGAPFDVTVFVKDKYGPVFNWTSIQIDINGTLYTAYPSTTEFPEYTLWAIADFLLGPSNFSVYVNATHGNPWSGVFGIRTYSDAATDAQVFSSLGWTVTQGDQPIIELHFFDWADRPVAGAIVTVFVNALSYNLLVTSPGVYAATVSTAGWIPGPYEYVVSVTHPDVETGEPINGTLIVLGQLEFIVEYSPETPTQGQPLTIIVGVVDGYGNPVADLEVFIEFMGLPAMIAYATDQVGEYVVTISLVPTSLGYGDFTVAVTAVGDFVEEAVDTSTNIRVEPATPNFAMSTSSLSLGAGASFVLSLIGMVIYFRMASSMRVDDKSLEGRKKSLKNMDRLYLLIVLGSGAGLVASYSMYTAGNYAFALILTVALLGCSVLLYGLWLYRDATAAVLVRGSLSRGRMVLGLWHLVFVPLVIFMILVYGVEIDWFRRYIIDVSFTIGDISIPSIMTTIFAAYMSSILVVVVNLYREVSKGLKKIVKMEDAGTPSDIVEDERTSMVSRFGSSVRIKFLMFLVVVGATTVMSLDFLASWELAVIVLLPVAFLVVIPFISSKIIQLFSRLSGGRIPTAPTDT